MKIRRVIPPAAAPVDLLSLLSGLMGVVYGTGYLKRLENEIKDYFKVNHVFLFSSGKAALAIALRALKTIAPGKDEVIIPAYTCYSVPSAIIRAGLKIAPCDLDPSCLDFDYDQLEKTINDKTLCIVPTHLFGIPADMDRVRRICRRRSIFILEDAAQAMGGTYKQKRLGTIGDLGLFSLGRGKNVTCGSGGILVTNSDRIASFIAKEWSPLAEPGFPESIVEFL
ncbi:MAG TPA: aminotransferase class I/II-fold pyridoxal phosphate-dependent enzyme, partial [Dissulfurispiraceae bacterium]|nr:aminotransferase class I/II-fold pyridoxal phosphate-dependent enzyme [Dissulfurispiraceae bacterium]